MDKQHKTLKISSLKENPDNTRIHPDKQIEELMKSVKKFGQVRPICVDETNTILIGHALKTSMERLGMEDADCLVIKGLTSDDKKKLLLSDNKIYSLGVDDFDAIDRIITELSDFEIPGFNSEDLEALYGQSSIGEEENNFKVAEEDIKNIKEKQTRYESGEAKVSESVTQQRAEIMQAEENPRYVICPNCGEKIYVD